MVEDKALIVYIVLLIRIRILGWKPDGKVAAFARDAFAFYLDVSSMTFDDFLSDSQP